MASVFPGKNSFSYCEESSWFRDSKNSNTLQKITTNPHAVLLVESQLSLQCPSPKASTSYIPMCTSNHKAFTSLLSPTQSQLLDHKGSSPCCLNGAQCSNPLFISEILLKLRGLFYFFKHTFSILHEEASILVREATQCSKMYKKYHTCDQVIIISVCRTLGQIPCSKQPFLLPFCMEVP